MLLFPAYSQQEKSISYVDSLTEVVSSSSDTYTLIKAYAKLCWIQRSRKPADAIEFGNQALNLINQNPEYDTLRPEILNYLGVVYRNKGDYSAAVNYYFDALKAAEKDENILQIAYSNNNLGGIFTLKGDYINAIDYMEKALFSFKLINNNAGMGYVCINLGNLYRHNLDFDEAINCFNDAINYKEMVSDSIGISIALNLKAKCYFQNNNIEEAARLFDKLQVLYEKNQDYKGLAVVKNSLGRIDIKNRDFNSALKFFEEAYEINKEIDYKQGQSVNLSNMGLAHYYLNNEQAAFRNLNSGYELAKQIGDSESLLIVYENYSKTYNDMGNYKKAYDFQVLYNQEYQKKQNYETRERLNSLKINNELDKSDEINEMLIKNNKEKEAEIIKLNNGFLIYRASVIVLLFILVLLTFRVVRLSRRNKSKLNDNKDLKRANEKLQDSNRLRERFLSIIGHDLKNPFNSVLGLTSLLVEEWDSIPDSEKKYIINEVNGTGNTLYELMDNLLLWAKNQNQAIRTLNETFDINETIVDVYELFRNQASFKEIQLQLEIGEKNLVFADPNMINTVIRNLVSNAIKFTRKGGRVLMEVKRKTNEVEFSITDNGKGILPEDLKRILDEKTSHTTKGTANETGTGLGLLLVKDFVRQNNGIFWVDSKPGVGSQFCFTLPTPG